MSTALTKAEAREVGRGAAVALNQTALLHDVLVQEIRALGALYVVGKRKPISELTPEQQERVRSVYADTGWASDYGVEIICVCTSQKIADEICKARGPNYFHTKQPIDSPLPDAVVFGEWAHTFPGSDAKEMYENLAAATIAVPLSHLRAQEEERARLQQQIDELRGT